MADFTNRYPYTDFHELNLDWFLEEFKKVTDKVGTLEETVQQFTDFVTNYFDNLDVQEEVNKKLDAMAADGTLKSLLEPYFDEWTEEVDGQIETQNAMIGEIAQRMGVMEGRMDTFASLPDGSIGTTADAELVDIRNGLDHRTWATAGDAVRRQLQDIMEDNVNSFPILTSMETTFTQHDLTLTNLGDGYFHLQGTASAGSNMIIMQQGTYGLPLGFEAGKTVTFLYESNDATTPPLQIYSTVDYGVNWVINKTVSTWVPGEYTNGQNTYTIPATSTGLMLRLRYYTGDTFNCTFRLKLYDDLLIDPKRLMKSFEFGMDELDLNNIMGETSAHILTDDHVYTNVPPGFPNRGFLINYCMKYWNLQVIWPFTGGVIWKRRGNSYSNVWETWQQIAGGGGDTYVYNNTYNVTATPSITTDTNDYLASTGDNTDRTNDIATMLATYGVCRLGPGVFYVDNLQMPDGTMITGAGKQTQIIKSTLVGYTIKLGSYCTVSDVMIEGAPGSTSTPSADYDHNGILWYGTYSQDQTAPKESMISNVWIHGFSGGGIRCHDTGYGTANGLLVTNVYTWNCYAGVYIDYWSEYHKFTNVRTNLCYYGCINNGGNNLFINCDFSSCTRGFMMNNTNDLAPNNSHGSCIGCVFNHSGSNTNIGIYVINCGQGFIFSGCQIFYSEIYLKDAKGMVFSNCNFGVTNCEITVDGGGSTLFLGNMHEAAPTINITNNANVKFANCYDRSGNQISA